MVYCAWRRAADTLSRVRRQRELGSDCQEMTHQQPFIGMYSRPGEQIRSPDRALRAGGGRRPTP